MTCPHCGGSAHRHSISTTGKQRYRCKACRKTFSESTGQPAGRPTTDTPAASTVRWRRHRERGS